jgi:hypothetical protein
MQGSRKITKRRDSKKSKDERKRKEEDPVGMISWPKYVPAWQEMIDSLENLYPEVEESAGAKRTV